MRRKWAVTHRPTKLSQMILSDDAYNALKKPTFPLLITGSTGTGKTTIAKILGKRYNCEMIELNASSDSSIDTIREIIERIKFKPMNNDGYMIVIDEAHALLKKSIDALLTVFEMPQTTASWILLTDQPHKLPQSMVSRMSVVELQTPSLSDMMDIANTILEIENVRLNKELIKACIQVSNGSIRSLINRLQDAYDSNMSSVKKSADEYASEIAGSSDACEQLIRFVKNGEIPAVSVMAVYTAWTQLMLYAYHNKKGNPWADRFVKTAKPENNKLYMYMAALNGARGDVVVNGADPESALLVRLTQANVKLGE